MRTLIVTGDYCKPGQTFVNRHILELFGGNTCVLANGFTGHDPHAGVARLIRRQVPRTFADRVTAPFTRAANHLRRGTSRIPVGAQRRAILRFFAEQRVAAVLGEFGTETLAFADLAQELGLPCFSYFRGTDASMSLRQRSRVRGYLRMMPKLAGVFAVSRFLLDNLARHDIVHANAHVIPSGVDTDHFVPSSKVPHSYLAVGRMIDKKAPLATLRAFAAGTAGPGGSAARLRIIGDGPLLAPARALAAELGIAERVAFDGAQPHDAVQRAMAAAQMFLQHSVTAPDGNTEGLPTSIQEALASGCIVISTRHAGIPEAIDDGVNGWLCDEHDAAAYADLVRRSLTADTAAMARAARDTACTRFHSAVLLARVEAVIRAAA